MDYGIAIIMSKFNQFTVEDIKKLSINQYKAWLNHAANLLSGTLMNKIELSYKDTRDSSLRTKLQQLQSEAEARK